MQRSRTDNGYVAATGKSADVSLLINTLPDQSETSEVQPEMLSGSFAAHSIQVWNVHAVEADSESTERGFDRCLPLPATYGRFGREHREAANV